MERRGRATPGLVVPHALAELAQKSTERVGASPCRTHPHSVNEG